MVTANAANLLRVSEADGSLPAFPRISSSFRL
jgi:hypothetical protein